MRYTSGRCARVFYLHIEHGEDLVNTIRDFVSKQEIQAGIIHLIGAVRNARIVTGPKEDTLPPDPSFVSLQQAHELIGTGMIRTGSDGPEIHFHISAGRGETALTGCLRGESEVFIIIEAVIIEFSGMEIGMSHDPKTGLSLPDPV